MSAPLAERLGSRWKVEKWTRPGDRVLVACSGGLDSLVLLHLLRFQLRDLALHPEVAHFRHRMRPDDAFDARWLRGVAGAWDLPFHLGEAASRPRNEAEARSMRYDFLHALRDETGARWIVTAHHRDDQIETVLFRMARGTGVRGLAGIASSRDPGVLRPLLEFDRGELERYAESRCLTPLVDPTNRDLSLARNRIRRSVLPELERVHPGARVALARLQRNAARSVEALEALLDPILEGVLEAPGDAREVVLDRERFLAQPLAVQGELLLHLLRTRGWATTEAGTTAALEFMRTGASGGRVHLPGSILLVRDFDRIRLERGGGSGSEPEGRTGRDPAPFVVSAPDEGEGRWRGPAGAVRVRWGRAPALPGEEEAAFDPGLLRFPLSLRGREGGERIRLAGGRRKVKKVLGELRVPRDDRVALTFLVDAEGAVLWIPGWIRSVDAVPGADREPWYIRMGSDESD